MRHPAVLIGDYYRKHELLDANTVDCMEYTLKSFLNEVSKAVSYAVLFSLLGLLIEYALCYISFVSVRIFAGGIHCKTYWGCFVTSLFLISICVLTPMITALNLQFLLILSIISVIFPLLFSPVTPTFRIIKKEKHRKKLKLIAAGTTLLWVACAWFWLDQYSHRACVLLSVIIANYQLPIPLIKVMVSSHHVKLKTEMR